MQSFKDQNGKPWAVEINVTAIKRVRTLLGVDLCKVFDEKLTGFQELESDPVKLVDVLYVLCREQATTASITDEDFGRLMAGDVLHEAKTAFYEACVDFLSEAKQRTVIRAMLAKGRTVSDKAMAVAMAEIEKMDLETITQSVSGTASTNSPASSASTPAPLPLLS